MYTCLHAYMLTAYITLHYVASHYIAYHIIPYHTYIYIIVYFFTPLSRLHFPKSVRERCFAKVYPFAPQKKDSKKRNCSMFTGFTANMVEEKGATLR